MDCATGNSFSATVAANSAFLFLAPGQPVGDYAMKLKVVHTGGAITWPASVRWPEGVAPALTVGRTHLFWFTTDDNGVKWFASVLAGYPS